MKFKTGQLSDFLNLNKFVSVIPMCINIFKNTFGFYMDQVIYIQAMNEYMNMQ